MDIPRHASQPDDLVVAFDWARGLLVGTAGTATGIGTGTARGTGVDTNGADVGVGVTAVGTGVWVVEVVRTGGEALCAVPVPACHPIPATMPNSAVVEIPAKRIFDVRAGLLRFFELDG